MEKYFDTDEKYMRRCIELASKAEGFTYPNPMVGAVIVHEGMIIGEGFHLKAGGPHAEVNAINSVKEASLLKESTMYVSLEPCSHYGKTPPCADLLIEKNIPRVVVGTTDTNGKVYGKGIKKLMEAGVDVKVGVLEDECRWINRRFFTFQEKKRPYVILKWAESSDGYIDIDKEASDGRGSYWISGDIEKVLVHKWRATEQAILVGGKTVRVDNPRLDVRCWKGKNPLRIVLSGSGNIPDDASIFTAEGETVIFTYNKDKSFNNATKVVMKNDMSPAEQILDYLYERGIQSLIVEGGAETHNLFVKSGLWDEARIFRGNVSFNRGVKAPVVNGKTREEIQFNKTVLRIIEAE